MQCSNIGGLIMGIITIYGPMIYTAPRIRILMRADG